MSSLYVRDKFLEGTEHTQWLEFVPIGFLGSVLTRRSAHAREAAQACVLRGLSPENLALCSLILLHSVLSSLVPSSQRQSVCLWAVFSSPRFTGLLRGCDFSRVGI